MKILPKIIILIAVICCNFAFIGDSYRYLENDSFQAGEKYDYRVKFGFVSIGLANVKVSEKIYTMNNRPCYRIAVFGRTSGIIDVFKIRNTYLSYVDTLAIIPHQFIYNAREGNFKRDQTIYFNHQRTSATRIENDEKKKFDVPKYCQDVVSGYYFLRTLPFENMRIGEVISAPMFFSDELYNLKVKFKGRKTINTKFGKIKVFEINPILPPNDLFDGPDAIKVYVSDDKNRVPIEIFIDFKVGSATMELKGYKNQRYPFEWR
jgi:hypothetical protein